MKSKNLILLLLVPLSEIKAIFYRSDLRVSWYLFSDNKKYLCNVIEDYSNILIIGIVLYYSIFVKFDLFTRQILLLLFILNALDLVFLGLFDNEYYLIKLPITALTYIYVNNKAHFKRN
jgi:hypothetical protein